MNESDLQYLLAAPDGRTVIRTGRLVIRELVRKDAIALSHMLQDISENEAGSLEPALKNMITSGDTDTDEMIMRLGALIAGDITDQYRFFGYGLWGVFLADGQDSVAADYGASERAHYSSEEISPENPAVRNSRILGSICVKSQKIIGLAGLKNGSAAGIGEICYYICPEYRRQGFAYEACMAVMDYAKECGFESLEARTGASNLRSLRLLDKFRASGPLPIDILYT
ncbi:MAG: GNAT family N-acetyltransferase [Lachnospiraceae bacterium]|nr:GNAT family N-acetyltransferase [Lachnospiraceae bacterium]